MSAAGDRWFMEQAIRHAVARAEKAEAERDKEAAFSAALTRKLDALRAMHGEALAAQVELVHGGRQALAVVIDQRDAARAALRTLAEAGCTAEGARAHRDAAYDRAADICAKLKAKCERANEGDDAARGAWDAFSEAEDRIRALKGGEW